MPLCAHHPRGCATSGRAEIFKAKRAHAGRCRADAEVFKVNSSNSMGRHKTRISENSHPCRRISRISLRKAKTLAASLKGLDSLLSMVQMPGGIPVATFAIGKPGAINAALFAAAILALSDDRTKAALDAYRAAQAKKVAEAKLP